MPPRLSRRFWAAVAAPVALLMAIATARLMRHATSPPQTVGSGRVERERNLFTDLYGARVAGGVILFDAGVDPAGGALDRLLRALGATRSDVRDVFLTHGHFDHVAASPLCAHARIRVGQPDVAFLAHRAPVAAPALGKLLNAIFPVGPIEATDPLVGRVVVGSGDDHVLAIPTPGHTPGSYVFVFDHTLFAGDTLVIDGARLAFADPKFCVDRAENRRSIARLGEALAGVDVQTVCTGHQGCTEKGRAPAMLAALIAQAKAKE